MSTPVDPKAKGIQKYAITQENADQIANTLCQMRGAALKLGQMLSLAEDDILHPIIKNALCRARNSAYCMPLEQVHQVLHKNYGPNWKSLFTEFVNEPIAAASIGQVHKAKLSSGQQVVLKIQYPGVKQSIDSDLENFKLVMNTLRLLPRSFYLNEVIDGIKEQFKEECDYEKEAEKQCFYKKQLSGLKQFYVPSVYSERTTKEILCQEYIEAKNIEEHLNSSIEIKNWIGEQLFYVCLYELFTMNFVQTDPNPGNFYVDTNKKILYLFDFGACRRYPKEFARDYLALIRAAISKDASKVLQLAVKLKFLTGEENKAAIKSFTNITFAFGKLINGDPYTDYSTQEATKIVYEQMPLIIQNRLSAIPNDIIHLHRKFSGALLEACRLKCKIPARQLFEKVVGTIPDNLYK
jgi:aarF domain-containing kinase